MKDLIKLLLLLLFCFQLSCTSDKSSWPDSKNWAWMYPSREFSENDWNSQLISIQDAGIDGILLLKRSEDPKDFETICRKIKESGFELHVWIPVNNPHGADSLEVAHPDWYQVSREGKSCLTDPPYIPSYKWLCPNNPDARKYLISVMDELAALEYLDGVHLDYIRFPDVILPVGIQPKYKLTQDKEYAEFDFCYCEHCREKFQEETGLDPIDLDDPASNEAWVQFRYSSITSLVHDIKEKVHNHKKKLSAAVFPTPELAKKLVRQDWTNWGLDEVMPMIYHQYYFEPLSWIETATSEGINALPATSEYFSGLFINEIKPKDFADAVNYAKTAGADGICLFNGNGMSKKQWKALKKALD